VERVNVPVDGAHLRISLDGLLAAAKCVARENLIAIAHLERQLAAVEKKVEAELAALEALERRLREEKI
jgi:hypothetical protein